MIKNIIFDFGDIFINLDKKRFAKELLDLGISQEAEVNLPILNEYEMGLISTEEFVAFFEAKFNVSKEKLVKAWNSILLDFPKNRLKFIQELAESKKYRLFLLSNTNDLHISWIQNNVGSEFYNSFKICFEQFYLTHEIHLRKPNVNIYEFVLNENNLIAEETLFIDDTKENTVSANILGIHTWNLIPGEEEVTELFTKKENLF
ncbi:HAD-IA family hydrolase [Polaribacter sp. HaHaR_3_91]|uniref:HAD-IA family hydrolase n=1 Tax=Polaribacter sp. HaHaR_3_91 TaxID=2745561 RepID=UPI001C4E4A05|nr:HAD-IA family hydrolase [Polaribacter sp. HaHaR_3_91]QXP62571.1 HAD-IA family hydrolase [Polaribacter sp. HaHaR_3_91]